ncbi:hypothetical protein HPP92_027509 [Vanilla planifolia]|uniref:Uncharacterized protein n=1 Tax=Vanilla planifolia TaxID=51239 RepID=A0A835PBE7_VANPL|nr:hypothetical protein HPP92_027509 [Vanilla planifolia]
MAHYVTACFDNRTRSLTHLKNGDSWATLRSSLSPESRSRSRAHLVSRSRRKVVAIVRAEVRYVKGEEAKKLVEEEGYVVLMSEMESNTANLTSSPLVIFFVENNDNDFGTIVKRTLHNNFVGLFFGLPFTKLNPDFVQEAKRQFTGDTRLVVVCQRV